MGRPKKEKVTNNPRLLSEDEVKEFDKNLFVCSDCGEKPQIIEKSIYSEYSSYVEKKHKCYCPNCQKGTGFSGNYSFLMNWNKMNQPLKYENCYVYSFLPEKDNNKGFLLDDFNYRFNISQHEIIQRKGGERFLYYLLETQEKKLDLDRFVDDVCIYQKSSFSNSYKFEDIDVCVVIAKSVDMAKMKLSKEIGDGLERQHQNLLRTIENKKDCLRKAKDNLFKFEEYIKENSFVKEK